MDYLGLRNSPYKPRVHPNGFVQLDLSYHQRLHVWPDPLLKTREADTPMHDHTFSFVSTVLVGTLKHLTYESQVNLAGLYRLYEVFPFKALDAESPLVLF